MKIVVKDIFLEQKNFLEKLRDLHSELPLLPKRIKIDKCKKLVCDLHNKKKYVVHIKSLKQALNNRLKLKRVHRIIEFSQKSMAQTIY